MLNVQRTTAFQRYEYRSPSSKIHQFIFFAMTKHFAMTITNGLMSQCNNEFDHELYSQIKTLKKVHSKMIKM